MCYIHLKFGLLILALAYINVQSNSILSLFGMKASWNLLASLTEIDCTIFCIQSTYADTYNIKYKIM